jgi:hypothetical protein
MARGNARQKIVRDDADWHRLIDGLAQAVIRYTWERHRCASWQLPFGSRADSMRNLMRRLEGWLKASPRLADDLAEIMKRATPPATAVGPTVIKA